MKTWLAPLVLVLFPSVAWPQLQVLSDKGYCNGMLVGREGKWALVLTCAHGVGAVNLVEGRTAYLVKSDGVYDLALLKVMGVKGEPDPLGFYALPGDIVKVKSRRYPGKRELFEPTGVIAWCMRDGSASCVLEAYKGMSGSPVYNEHGHVVGMLWGCTDDGKRAAVREIGRIRRFLHEYQQAWLAKHRSGGAPAVRRPVQEAERRD